MSKLTTFLKAAALVGAGVYGHKHWDDGLAYGVQTKNESVAYVKEWLSKESPSKILEREHSDIKVKFTKMGVANLSEVDPISDSNNPHMSVVADGNHQFKFNPAVFAIQTTVLEDAIKSLDRVKSFEPILEKDEADKNQLEAFKKLIKNYYVYLEKQLSHSSVLDSAVHRAELLKIVEPLSE